jgi:Na+/H+-dicarboxylate symporter
VPDMIRTVANVTADLAAAALVAARTPAGAP